MASAIIYNPLRMKKKKKYKNGAVTAEKFAVAGDFWYGEMRQASVANSIKYKTHKHKIRHVI